MITKINLNDVTSYKNLAYLETDKKVNLIYGLNGTGKSTLSDFLYDKSDSVFTKCSLEGFNNEEILVYNQRFIKDYFYEPDNLNGIFTLSKGNKEAEKKIRNAEAAIKKLEVDKTKENESIGKLNNDITKKKQTAENTTWEIKGTYTGGDRVLEFCLEGLKGKKEKLFNHISAIAKPSQKPNKTTGQLKKEVEAFQGDNAQKLDSLPAINFTSHKLEIGSLLQKEIIGNENSSVAGLIKQLDNSDWVKEGLKYLSDDIADAKEPCPFCQEKTITKNVVDNIKDYFDETYENDLNGLKKLLTKYEDAINSIPLKENYNSNALVIASKSDFENKYSNIKRILNKNKRKIEDKLKTPSQKSILTDSTDAIDNFNLFVKDINYKVMEHNRKIDNKDESLNQIKSMFWNLMRWEYDQTISAYEKDNTNIQKKTKEINTEIRSIENNVTAQKDIITKQQINTVNIEEAIANINSGLVELGIDSFRIVKHSDIFYKIVRDEQDSNTFQTLSEGEKMIISFLYFRELCEGKKNAKDISNKKIVVIDDPISSLSHIYIFNIGQLIKNNFFNSDKYDQIFVLTHSLYFYYELTDANHKRRKDTQKLFRMIKNCDGSQILDMKYDEVQNDYQSYWYIVKDENQPPALIANCMRNIIEYFFNFIEKKDLNNVFQKPELQKNQYQAFCRYINRESHSLGQNIFDYKEFNYSNFKEALGLVFQESGYKEHYEEMIK